MAQPFALFNADHLWGLLVVLIIAMLPPFVLKRTNSQSLNQTFASTLGWIMAFYGIFKHLYGPFGLGEPWQIWLPFHLCQIANFLIAFALITGKRGVINEVIYFWTFGGATMALLTPDLKWGWPDPNYILYIITHALLILGALHFSIVDGFRPRTDAIWRVFKISVAYMLVIFPLNYIIGEEANYLYLRYPPAAGSLMDILPAPPGHIPFIMLIAYLLFWMTYLPLLIRDGVQNRQTVIAVKD